MQNHFSLVIVPVIVVHGPWLYGVYDMNPLFSVGYLPGEKELRTSGQQVLDFVSAVDPAQGIMGIFEDYARKKEAERQGMYDDVTAYFSGQGLVPAAGRMTKEAIISIPDAAKSIRDYAAETYDTGGENVLEDARGILNNYELRNALSLQGQGRDIKEAAVRAVENKYPDTPKGSEEQLNDYLTVTGAGTLGAMGALKAGSDVLGAVTPDTRGPSTPTDPTRRQVLAGIGSLAIAPEAILQAGKKAGKKVGKKVALTPLASRLAGLKAISKGMMPDLMRQDDLMDIQDDFNLGGAMTSDPYKDAGIPPPKPNEMGNLEARIKEARDKYFEESLSMFDEVADASLSEIAKLDIDNLQIIHRQHNSYLGHQTIPEEKIDAIRDMIISKAEQMPERFKIDEIGGKKYIVQDMMEEYEDSRIPFADGGRVASRLTGLGSMGYMI